MITDNHVRDEKTSIQSITIFDVNGDADVDIDILDILFCIQ